MTIPICAVTGRIAGDADACGDCDPCGAAHMVPDAVKRVLTEKEEWRQKYGNSAAEIERLRGMHQDMCRVAGNLGDENERLRAALKPFADYADPRRGVPPSFQITAGSQMARKQLLMQDCYRAKDALGDEQTAD